MGKIKKVSPPKHEATAQFPWLSKFTNEATIIDLPRLPLLLSTFPSLWPFPRGDRYHWISVLDRFDAILEDFIAIYGLHDGPQTITFSRTLLRKHVQPTEGKDSDTLLDELSYGPEGDRELVESVLDFSRLLLEKCKNRGPYSSSDRVNDLLNTTSLSLLQSALRIGVPLAQRYHSRMKNSSSNHVSQTLLNAHYNLSLDRLQLLAAPFPKPQSHQRFSRSRDKPTQNQHEDVDDRAASLRNANDIVALFKCQDDDSSDVWTEWGTCCLSYHPPESERGSKTPVNNDTNQAPRTSVPGTPSPAHRASTAANQNLRTSSQGMTSEDTITPAPASTPQVKQEEEKEKLRTLEIPASEVKNVSLENLLKKYMPQLPVQEAYHLLARLRAARALITSQTTRTEILATRILAIANLAYIYPESMLQQKIFHADSEEPKRLQLVYQLAEFAHLSATGDIPASVLHQSFALDCLDALANNKMRPAVCSALNVNVNHGILMYLLRKAISDLTIEDEEAERLQKYTAADKWRDSLFSIFRTLPDRTSRVPESFVQAGFIQMLVEILNLRTAKAKRLHPRVVEHITYFVQLVRESLGILAQAKGFDAISGLISYGVESSFDCVKQGKGFPAEYKTPAIDYQIPFVQQLTLKSLFKFINFVLQMNTGGFERLLRNLIDTPALLNSLKTVLENATVVGSTIWSGAVNVLSNFLNNEPTSYSVIAEAGLSKSFLQAVMGRPFIWDESTLMANESDSPMSSPEPRPSFNPRASVPGDRESLKNQLSRPHDTKVSGILPSAEAISAIPGAFTALCLNNSGLRLFQQSDALESFFNIFESPEHIKCMKNDDHLLKILGELFDEFYRHQPVLKPSIMSAVLLMTARVGLLCRKSAYDVSAGAKLWVDKEDDQTDIAGGAYLVESRPVPSLYTEVEDEIIRDAYPNGPNSAETEHGMDTLPNGLHITSYVFVLAKFLSFYLRPQTTSAFMDAGGTELVLDLFTLPGLPFGFHNTDANRMLTGVVRTLTEAKPHLVFPSLLTRAQFAVDQLEPFWKSPNQSGFFTPMTRVDIQDGHIVTDAEEEVKFKSTFYVKQLVNIFTLTNILHEGFRTHGYVRSSQTSMPFFNLNIADLLAKLCSGLSRIHAAALWEEITIQKTMPSEWADLTKTTNFDYLEDENSHCPGPFAVSLQNQPTPPENQQDASTTNGGQALTDASTYNSVSQNASTKKGAAFKNTKILRFLLSNIPVNIVNFFRSLGTGLILKRRLDLYQRQKAIMVSDAIASSFLHELNLDAPRNTGCQKDHFSYLIVSLSSFLLLLFDSTLDHSPSTFLTVVLQSFKKLGGIQVLKDIMDLLMKEILNYDDKAEASNDEKSEDAARLASAFGGVKIIISFFAEMTSKGVTESGQAKSMACTDRDRQRVEYFNPSQFLVELRAEILPKVKELWHSGFVEKANGSTLSALVNTLRQILDKGNEGDAYRRSDILPSEPKSSPVLYGIDHGKVEHLKEKGFDEELVREALYRCKNHSSNAEEYCLAQRGLRVPPRVPPPENDVTIKSSPVVSHGTGSSPDFSPLSAMFSHIQANTRQLNSLEAEPGNDGAPANTQPPSEPSSQPPPSTTGANQEAPGGVPTLPLANLDEDTMDLDSSPSNAATTDQVTENNFVPPPSNTVSAHDTDVVTIEDLNEARETLLKDLIDRCLEVLESHLDMTFQMAELITSATATSKDPDAYRRDAASTLVPSLLSLQMDENYQNGGKKIAAYAHVLAVVFLDKKFYNAAVPRLKESFAGLVDFIKMPPVNEKTTENSYAWIGQILLIIEYLLSTDEKPQVVEPLRQNPDGSFQEDQPPPPKREPLVSLDGRNKVFDAVIDILPRIGKNESLALSVCRILVILTRHSQLSCRLGERRNLQRLFVMMKQVTSATNSRLHSAFMLILRHLIEDEEIIRNIIKKEIISQFDSRPTYDISTYMRKFSHAIIRDPETFVGVTGDLVKLQRYDPHSRQILALKSDEPEPTSSSSDEKNDTKGDSKAEPESEESNQTKEQKEKPKPDQSKAPVVERPDGVIHYLLSELLSYREVEDKEVSPEQSTPEQHQGDNQNARGGDQGPLRDRNQESQSESDQSASSSPKKADQKPRFKPEEHPIFIYRCFLLQCLSELLSSYNHTKVEFINFSRKADPFASTPSKPRAAVLNYLLNALIPVGTLENDESMAFKKKVQTSDFAQNCVVALCAKPGESTPKDEEDEPELVFVRKFVLEHALKAYKETGSSQESLDVKYSRYLTLSDLFQKLLLDGKPLDTALPPTGVQSIAKMMFEKNFINVLTSSIAEIDLSFPSAKRAVKYMLRPLDTLTRSVVYLSETSSISTVPTSADEDEISSATSVSDFGDELEVAPNLFRHSTLGMFNADEEEPSTSEEEVSEEDDEMYDDEMEFEQDISGQDDEGDSEGDEDDENDEEGDGEEEGHRHMEGLSGDVPMDVVEVLLSEDEHDDDENDTNSELDQDDHHGGAVMSDMGEEPSDEINGDNENHSLHGDEDEWESEEMDEENGSAGMLHQMESEFDDIVHQDHPDMDLMRALGTSNDPADRAQSDFDTSPEDEDEEEVVVSENEDEDPVEEIIEEGEHEDDDGYDDEMLDVITGAQDQPARHRHRHFGTRHGPSPWTVITDGAFNRGADPSFSSRLPPFTTGSNHNLDGRNPLLNVSPENTDAAQPGNGDSFSDWFHAVDAPSQNGVIAMDTPITFLNAIFQTLSSSGQDVSVISRSNGLHVRIDPSTIPPGIQDAFSFRRDLGGSTSQARDDPATAIRFPVTSTIRRWQEEAALLFPDQYADVASRIGGSLQRLLAPPAYKAEKERQKKQAEEAKRREKERRAKEQKEKEEAQKKLEEEAAKKRQEEEERAAAEAAASQERPEEVVHDQQQSPSATENAGAPEPSEPTPRVYTNIRGRELDITGLEIDPEYLEALPEDLREEVIMHQLSERRSQAAAAGEEPSGISSEFLEALPPDIREEILQQEAADRRRRQREAARREQAAASGNAQPEEMDSASFIATLDPSLRQVVLAEQPEEILNTLGPNFLSEARALTGGRLPTMSAVGRPEHPAHPHETPTSPRDGQAERKPQRRQIVQMLDKGGIAALLRLMYLPLQTKTRGHLHDVLNSACQNRHNRIEILSMLTLVLKDGSNDMSALERSFNHLSLRAKQTPFSKPTPPGKRLQFPIPSSESNEDVTPLLVTQQCLSLLEFLARGDAHISWFFITEHEALPAFKSIKSARRNKGKEKENRSNKFALNYLLSLLERSSIMNSPACMEQLSNLLNLITQPLTILSRREKERAEAEQAKKTEKQQAPSEATQTTPAAQEPTGDTTMANTSPAAGGTEEPSQPSAATEEKETGEKPKKQRAFEPPVVPERNLKLVVHILAARECNAKTFRETLSTINNMSCIPGAKEIIGKELASQCQALCQSILSDLNDFLPQIEKAQNGTDIQGVALWKFSPASSDQAKLLRVLTALDYLFDRNRIEKENDQEGALQKDAILKSFYESASFSPLWLKLSECLRVIRHKDDMLNVATILLPLIESLMVVCKNTALKDTKPLRRGNELATATPAPDTGMEGLFFNFTEEHRKILNELVRQNPKLMIGTFSLLVKNQAVLEFDNKRNYFSKRLHARHLVERQACPPLHLSIRRDNVFLDSFKALYFKTAQEMKYGKLNIHFHGEEGIDAGGVTREWFHVLARGMFNPNYALFIPVASDRTTFHPNPLSGVNQEHLLFFRFIGRIIGKALYEGRVLDCHFSRAVYKRMLGRSVSVKDMETLDLDYYKSLQWMLANDITDILTENFAIEVDRFGETQVIDLIPDGRNIPVTEENKEAYVQRVVEYRLVGSVEEQLENFLKGFHDIIPAELVSIFSEQELELLISGLPEVDVDDWKGNTDYTNYTTKSPQIQWFWRAVRSFDKEERAKLLQFVTGTSKVPLNGFKELEGMDGVNRFSIHRVYGKKQHLPSAHTCFNQLDLPEYESYEELRHRLHLAMTAGSGYFGFG